MIDCWRVAHVHDALRRYFLAEDQRRSGSDQNSECCRACAALDAAGVPHAVVGGNAVAVWVGTIDEGAIRNTRDVDLLIRRADLPRGTVALEQAGFVRPTCLA